MKVTSGLEGVEETLASLSAFVAAEERALKEALEAVLREMANYAKKNAPFEDHTANLRNSISVNLDEMEELSADDNVSDSQDKKNREAVIEVSGDGYRGVISAGMEYAIWVELTDGYWVLTGAIDAFEPLIDKYFSDYMEIEELDLIAAADKSYKKFLRRGGLSEREAEKRIEAKHRQYSG